MPISFNRFAVTISQFGESFRFSESNQVDWSRWELVFPPSSAGINSPDYAD